MVVSDERALGAFRKVPRTGVIYVTAEATRLGRDPRAIEISNFAFVMAFADSAEASRGLRDAMATGLGIPADAVARAPMTLMGTPDEMVAELEDGRPVLVLLNLGASRLPVWHYAVLIGYDANRNVAILRSGETERLEMKWQRFAGAWHRGGRFAMTVLHPGVIPAHADPARFIEASAGLEAAGQRQAARTAFQAATSRWPAAR